MGCLKLTNYRQKLPRRWTVLCRKIKTTNPTLNYMNGANVISNYSYENDVLGRRTNIGITYDNTTKSNDYNYNPRSEVIGAYGDTLNQAFDYDNIGNRITSSNNDITTNYSANNLNQYETVGDFVPLFDADGNQTKIKTSKGEFLVEYNGENRPIKFTNLSDSTFITMRYDYMGRRGGKLHFNSQGQWQSTAKFFYKDYTLIEESTASNDVLKEFVWDPTAGSATRPLFLRLPGQAVSLLYCHDANKNVTEVSYLSTANGIGAHYEYDSFGNTITSTRNTRVSSPDLRTYNPFRFSSEYHDDELSLIYYNYRHYNPQTGRWLSRDPIEENGGYNLYAFVANDILNQWDILGQISYTKAICTIVRTYEKDGKYYHEYECICPDGYLGGMTRPHIPVDFPPPDFKCYKLDKWDYILIGCACVCAIADGPLPVGDGIGILILGERCSIFLK